MPLQTVAVPREKGEISRGALERVVRSLKVSFKSVEVLSSGKVTIIGIDDRHTLRITVLDDTIRGVGRAKAEITLCTKEFKSSVEECLRPVIGLPPPQFAPGAPPRRNEARQRGGPVRKSARARC